MAQPHDTNFDNNKYEELLKDHEKAKKKILKKEISTNPQTLKRYEYEIITAYNELVKYTHVFQLSFDEQSKNLIISEIQTAQEKTRQCAEKLNITVEFPENIFDPITHELPTREEIYPENSAGVKQSQPELTNSSANGNPVDNQSEHEISDSETEPNDEDDLDQINQSEPNFVGAYRLPIKATMAAKENRDFIKFAAQTINRNYSGDPLTLQAFINTVELVRATAETTQMELLKKFVVSRLDGKALECVDSDKDLDSIIADLRASIKVDSSDVIEGRLQALKLSKYGPVEFAKQAESLADALQRSLVLEGINLPKAREITIKKTVEMCKQTAKTDYVKSVLASTSFSDPKSVISKLIVEQNGQERDRQILTYSRQNSGYHKKRFNNYNNYNNSNDYNGHQNSCKPQFRKKFPNNRGARGGGRGRYRNNYNRGERREYNVRATENCDAPSGGRRDQDNQNGTAFTVERVSRN